MTLFKKAKGLPRYVMDCGWWNSKHWAGASLAEIGLHSCVVGYCNQHETDGLFPASSSMLARALGLDEKEVRKTTPLILRRGRWRKVNDDAFEVVGYSDHNPMSTELAARRRQLSKAAEKANHNRWHKESGDPDCSYCDSDSGSPRGSPLRSDSDTSTDSADLTSAESLISAVSGESAVPPKPPDDPVPLSESVAHRGGVGFQEPPGTNALVVEVAHVVAKRMLDRTTSEVSNRRGWLASVQAKFVKEHASTIADLLKQGLGVEQVVMRVDPDGNPAPYRRYDPNGSESPVWDIDENGTAVRVEAP